MKHLLFSLFSAALLLVFSLSFSLAQAPRSYTSSEILLQLKKLNTVGSVLYIAAHPDDENTRLIAYLANEKCLRTGYLSLTRGDGGQNLIGPEQGVELGVIRTQELLAARRIDGGEQFFTRAYDFGYSKTPKETFQKWNHDSVLSDVVWVIRNFRPDIIITRFATDGSGGHGHHTASAILAEEAFDAAGDPKRFPEQLQCVEVWQPRRLFYNATNRFRDPNADMSAFIKLDVGGYNPLLGKSYGEIAAESRSMHKSQGFGSAKQRGEYFEFFKPVKGDTAGLKDIFEGMDFSWKRVKGGERIGKLVNEVIRNFDVEKPETSAPQFAKVYEELYSLSYDFYHVKLAHEILLNTTSVTVDVTTSLSQFGNGEELKFTVNTINRGSAKVILKELSLRSNNIFLLDEKSIYKSAQNNTPLILNYKSSINKNIVPSEAFWLAEPLRNNMFAATDQYSNSTSNNILVTPWFEINGLLSSTSLPVQYKWVDPEKGELYRPLVITPPVMVNVINEVVAFSSTEAKMVSVVVKAGKDNLKGVVKLDLPSGWRSEPAMVDFMLAKKGEEKVVSFIVTPPTNPSDTVVKAIVEMDGKHYSKGIKEIKYDHIPIQTLFPETEIKLIRLDVKKKLKRIGYIPGAGDEVAPCLTQLGYEVVTITDDMLANENLNQFEAIVTGVRAYNTNEKMPQFKQKLMDYVNNGGNLIVQYNTNSWAGPLSSDIGPYKFKITRDRVTDENASVNFELPNHPVLNYPNKITAKDFEGWIQERCIYSAGEVDSNYVMPLSMADPDEKPNKGSLIIGKSGKGYFVYTGLVFFRELPAGIPGAYRLFVNILELGK